LFCRSCLQKQNKKKTIKKKKQNKKKQNKKKTKKNKTKTKQKQKQKKKNKNKKKLNKTKKQKLTCANHFNASSGLNIEEFGFEYSAPSIFVMKKNQIKSTQ